MTKSTGLIVWLMCVAPAFSQQQPLTVNCASPATGEVQSCPANTRDGVLLLREQSANICQQGSTWTYDRNAITVSGGCSADFMISGRGSRGYKDGNSYSDHGYSATLSTSGDPVSRGPAQATPVLPKRLPPTLPEGTQLAMQLDKAIRVSSMTQGQVLTGVLVKDLVIGSRIAAAVGSQVQAAVVSITGGQPDIRLTTLRAGSAMYPLQTTAVHGRRDLVEVDSTARGGFSTLQKQAVDPDLIFPGSIFVFRLVSTSQPRETP